MRIKHLILLAMSGTLITFDQAAKLYVHTHFRLHESVPVIENFFSLTYVRNFGAAFGFLAHSNPAFRDIFFLVMPPIALLVILMILRTVDEKDKLQITALSSVFGGAIGNYIDRLNFGFVVDYLDFFVRIGNKKYTWPAFNIADIAIVCGISVLLFIMITQKDQKPETSKEAEDSVSGP